MVTPLLTTKTFIPMPRTALVPRPRLIERLSAGLGRKLTLISAPAGFGKTTLVSEWVSRRQGDKETRGQGDKGTRGQGEVASSLLASSSPGLPVSPSPGLPVSSSPGLPVSPSPGLLVSCAWLSLDKGDNDPLRFWRYVIAALQTIDARIGQAVQAALETSQPPSPEELVATLINDCARTDVSPYTLVLDDYHVIENPAIHDGVNLLLDNLPPQLHLVIITREDPPLALPRRRGRAELVEIRVADLRFTVEETAQLLNRLAGLNLSHEDVNTLEKRTEGWAVGLQMAALAMQSALSMQQQTALDQHNFVMAFAGDDRYVVDYLVQEVFERQPPHIQTFLLQTSILERLCGPLCDEVRGSREQGPGSRDQGLGTRDQETSLITDRRSHITDSQSILEYLERANLFTTPLDNRRCWYRYHQLFADLLRQRLGQVEEKSHIDALYQRASAWCQQQELVAEAVSYALAACDLEYAAALIERNVLETFYDSEIALVHQWLKALPDEWVHSRPLLQAVYACTMVLLARYSAESLEQAERWLQEAETTLETQRKAAGGTHEPGRPTHSEVTGFIAKFRAYMARFRGDDPRTVVHLSQQALEHLPKGEPKFRSALFANMGYAYMLLDDESAADHAFAEARRLGELSGDLFNACAATQGQALLLRRRGRLREAAAICRDSLQIVGRRSEETGRPIPYAGGVLVALGDVMLEWNEMEEADHLLTQGVALTRLLPDLTVVQGTIALARLRRAQSAITEAFEWLAQADRLHPAFSPRMQGMYSSPSSARMYSSAYIAAYRLQLWLAQAENEPEALARAAGWVRERQITLKSQVHHDLDYLEQIALYRLLIVQRRLQGRPDLQPLLDCLGWQIHVARAKDWNEWAITLFILHALALQAQGNMNQAVVSLQQALTLAEPAGYVRIFVDEGEPMAALLRRAAAEGIAVNYVNRLLADFGLEAEQPAIRSPQSAIRNLVEPLSPREIEVLQLVATGATNPQIAQRLFITVDTVKKHLSNIFGKLAVKNRTQATTRGRELGLLE